MTPCQTYFLLLAFFLPKVSFVKHFYYSKLFLAHFRDIFINFFKSKRVNRTNQMSNKLVTCPYDEAHKVKESRLALHITKCRLNHLDGDKEVCPFNAKHIFPYQEKQYHMCRCPDRAPLDRKMYCTFPDNSFKGNTSVPSYTESAPTLSSENWEDDICSEPAPGYIAKEAPPTGGIFEPKAYSKPSERRRKYQELHREGADIEKEPNQPSNNLPKPPVTQLNRQPKAPSQVESKKNLQELHNFGLGRGRQAVPSRIAANIFPGELENKISAPSAGGNYSAALISGMSNLGIGRGNFINTVNNGAYDDENFPALGCGRGISRSKNDPRYPGSRN